MRSLWLISLVVAMQGCAPSPYSNLTASAVNSSCLEKFRPEITSVLYNTHINVVGKHLSGLLIFKKMEDQSTRVVFSNEMGVKFFDFEFKQDGFKVIYCMDKLNKKPVIRQLRKDIGVLLFHEVNISNAKTKSSPDELYFGFKKGKEYDYYITSQDCNELKRIENATSKKKKIITNLTAYKKGMPDSVYISHENFEFNISLKQIER